VRYTVWTEAANFTCARIARIGYGERSPRKAGQSGPSRSLLSHRKPPDRLDAAARRWFTQPLAPSPAMVIRPWLRVCRAQACRRSRLRLMADAKERLRGSGPAPASSCRRPFRVLRHAAQRERPSVRPGSPAVPPCLAFMIPPTGAESPAPPRLRLVPSQPWNLGWRTCPAAVHSVNATRPTSLGSTHWPRERGSAARSKSGRRPSLTCLLTSRHGICHVAGTPAGRPGLASAPVSTVRWDAAGL
jgi:hypothetical protein